jgi:hypothetical protein
MGTDTGTYNTPEESSILKEARNRLSFRFVSISYAGVPVEGFKIKNDVPLLLLSDLRQIGFCIGTWSLVLSYGSLTTGRESQLPVKPGQNNSFLINLSIYYYPTRLTLN